MELNNEFLIFASRYDDSRTQEETIDEQENAFTVLAYKRPKDLDQEEVYLFDAIPYAFRNEKQELNGDELTLSPFSYKGLNNNEIDPKYINLFIIDNILRPDRLKELENSSILNTKMGVFTIKDDYSVNLLDKNKFLEENKFQYLKSNSVYGTDSVQTENIKDFQEEIDDGLAWWAWLLIILGCLLVIVAAIVLVIFLKKHKNKTKNDINGNEYNHISDTTESKSISSFTDQIHNNLNDRNKKLFMKSEDNNGDSGLLTMDKSSGVDTKKKKTSNLLKSEII